MAKLGVWEDDVEIIKRTVRKLVYQNHDLSFNAEKFLETHKGKTLTVIIESVDISGFCLAYVKDHDCVIRIHPSYIETPTFSAFQAKDLQRFTEHHLLNHDVKFKLLEYSDSKKVFLGGMSTAEDDFISLLLGNGYARFENYSIA